MHQLTWPCSAGTFKQPLFAADGTTCTGIETADGTKHYADKVVLAAGAWSPTLVDLEDQCVSKVSQGRLGTLNTFSNQPLTSDKAWVFAHIQLTRQEAAEYKNVPVVYDGEYGFFFEPNE